MNAHFDQLQERLQKLTAEGDVIFETHPALRDLIDPTATVVEALQADPELDGPALVQLFQLFARVNALKEQIDQLRGPVM